MIRFECDMCGAPLAANDDEGRYIVRIEAFAAAGPVAFSEQDMQRDHTSEIKELLEQLNNTHPDAIEDQTYRRFRYDLCAPCHRKFLARPLPDDHAKGSRDQGIERSR